MITIIKRNGKEIKLGELNKFNFNVKYDEFILVNEFEKQSYLFYHLLGTRVNSKKQIHVDELINISIHFDKIMFRYNWINPLNDNEVGVSVMRSGATIRNLVEKIIKYNHFHKTEYYMCNLFSKGEQLQNDIEFNLENSEIKSMLSKFRPYFSEEYVWIGHESNLINYDSRILDISEFGDIILSFDRIGDSVK